MRKIDQNFYESNEIETFAKSIQIQTDENIFVLFLSCYVKIRKIGGSNENNTYTNR